MAIIQDRSADAIIEALGGNSSGMCRCPAHDDNTPSLHVSEGANGTVLFQPVERALDAPAQLVEAFAEAERRFLLLRLGITGLFRAASVLRAIRLLS